MTESRIHEQPAAEGDLAVVVTRRAHQQGCPALSGDNPCRCYENAVPNPGKGMGMPSDPDLSGAVVVQERDDEADRPARMQQAREAGEPQRCPRRDDTVYSIAAIAGVTISNAGDPRGDRPPELKDRWVELDTGIVGARGRHCDYCGSLHPDEFMAYARRGVEITPTDKNYKAYVVPPILDSPNGDKFYFQHLSEAQREEFIQLVNDRKMNIGYPGHFYRLPFFVRREPK